MLKTRSIYTVAMMLCILVLTSCRGQRSRKPPIDMNPNMDSQQKQKAFSENKFFEDGRSMRPLPEGVVARGHLNQDEFNTGKAGGEGEYINNPVPVNQEMLRRGQERFNIYCTPCHGATGVGNGIVVKKGFLPPPSYLDERVLNMKDGEYFNIITHGVRNMKGYGIQISAKDRWAIAAYIRVLQKSQLSQSNEPSSAEDK